MEAKKNKASYIEKESLKEESDHTLSEMRMVLPGVQALLGFQAMVVFNQRFVSLSTSNQYVHLASLFLIVLSTILAISPAAFHRISKPGFASTRLLDITSKLMSVSLFSLASGLCLDIYVVFILVLNSMPLSLGISFSSFIICLLFWVYFPLRERKFIG